MKRDGREEETVGWINCIYRFAAAGQATLSCLAAEGCVHPIALPWAACEALVTVIRRRGAWGRYMT